MTLSDGQRLAVVLIAILLLSALTLYPSAAGPIDGIRNFLTLLFTSWLCVMFGWIAWVMIVAGVLKQKVEWTDATTVAVAVAVYFGAVLIDAGGLVDVILDAIAEGQRDAYP